MVRKIQEVLGVTLNPAGTFVAETVAAQSQLERRYYDLSRRLLSLPSIVRDAITTLIEADYVYEIDHRPKANKAFDTDTDAEKREKKHEPRKNNALVATERGKPRSIRN